MRTGLEVGFSRRGLGGVIINNKNEMLNDGERRKKVNGLEFQTFSKHKSGAMWP